MKFLSTFIRSFGVMIIISIAVVCIFMGRIIRDMGADHPSRQYVEYIASFENRFYDYRIKSHLKLDVICDVHSLERTIKTHKLISFSELSKIFDDNDFSLFSRYCDNIQKEMILKLPIFNLPEYQGLKISLAEHFKTLPEEMKIERVNNLKQMKITDNTHYVSEDIVLIKVDDESLAQINSWPIPRENWSLLLDNLSKLGTKVVTFDVLFPEEVKSCGEVSPDQGLADAIRRFQDTDGQRVILSYTVQLKSQSDIEFFEEVPVELFTSMVDSRVESEDANLPTKSVEKHTWPIQKFLDAEPDLGYLNMFEDSDGVFRHYQIASNVDGVIFPSLGLRTYISYTGKNPTVIVKKNGNSHLQIDENKMDINANGESKIRWIGELNSYKTISLWQVLKGDMNDPYLKELLGGKIAFIGSTAIGAHDLRNTPINSKLPGVYAHMNFVDMLLQSNFYKPLESSMEKSFYFLGISMVLLVVIMLFGNAILDLFAVLLIIASSYYIDYAYFIDDGYQISLFFVYFCVISTYSYITFLNFNKASAEKKQIKGAFARYVAPSIVDDMLENPDKLKIGGEKRDITCMFSDVRDFTSISEMLSPTDLALALNKYMGKMTDIVFETNGTLDKYIGDAIVAFWGAPLDIGDHVNAAVEAGVQMLEALPAVNKEFKEKGYPEFKIGLGLNSGDCIVGNMGSEQIFAYTALGDNMNLGARLESLCKHYGAQILVSSYTFDRMDQEKYQTRLIDMVIVKGKTEPVSVYEVLYSYHPFQMDQAGLTQFKEAYQLFVDGKFADAKAIFEHLLEKHAQDKACLRLRESCEQWIKNPPAVGVDWWVTTMTTKG